MSKIRPFLLSCVSSIWFLWIVLTAVYIIGVIFLPLFTFVCPGGHRIFGGGEVPSRSLLKTVGVLFVGFVGLFTPLSYPNLVGSFDVATFFNYTESNYSFGAGAWTIILPLFFAFMIGQLYITKRFRLGGWMKIGFNLLVLLILTWLVDLILWH